MPQHHNRHRFPLDNLVVNRVVRSLPHQVHNPHLSHLAHRRVIRLRYHHRSPPLPHQAFQVDFLLHSHRLYLRHNPPWSPPARRPVNHQHYLPDLPHPFPRHSQQNPPLPDRRQFHQINRPPSLRLHQQMYPRVVQQLNPLVNRQEFLRQAHRCSHPRSQLVLRPQPLHQILRVSHLLYQPASRHRAQPRSQRPNHLLNHPLNRPFNLLLSLLRGPRHNRLLFQHNSLLHVLLLNHRLNHRHSHLLNPQLYPQVNPAVVQLHSRLRIPRHNPVDSQLEDLPFNHRRNQPHSHLLSPLVSRVVSQVDSRRVSLLLSPQYRPQHSQVVNLPLFQPDNRLVNPP